MSWRPPPKPGRFQITTTLLRAPVSSATFSNVFATTTTRFLIYSIARDAYSFHWILIVWLVLFLLLPPNGICPWERERLSRKRCLFLMKKSRTLPSRFYQASLPPVVLYCGTVPLCFAVQITVSPHSTHTIKEKEKERTKIWKPRPSISFFFFLVPISIVGRVIFCWPYVWPFISTENFFFDLVKKIILYFLILQMSGKRSRSFKCAVHHRDRQVCSENDFHLLLQPPTLFQRWDSLFFFFWLEINRVKRISTFSSSPSHVSVECLRGIKRRDYHQVRRRLYTHHTHDGVIGQGLIKASVTPALRAPQWRICQCVNHGKGDWIIYCCCSFQNPPPLLCLVWRTFHLIIYRLFAEWWRWLQTSSWRTNGSESITPTATRAARRPFSSSSSR